MSPRRIVSAAAVATCLVLAATPSAMAAADADEVAAVVRDAGFYVEEGSSASGEEIGAVVSDVRNEGENLILVVLAEEPDGGATTYAGAIFQRLGSSIVVVLAPETVGYDGISEVFSDLEIQDALERAVDIGGDDAVLARTFADELVGVPAGAPTTTQATAPAADGGGGGTLLWLLLVAGAVVLLFVWLARRNKARTEAAGIEQLEKARSVVRDQMSAVANDILDMEDEVRVSDDARADRFYEEATETYNEVTDAFEGAGDPGKLLDLSNRLDQAIWQLDSAEAILDGKPLPERPRPRSLEPSAPEHGGDVPGRPDQYERRPSRRSSYSGPSMMDILIMLGGAVMGGERRRSGALGGMFGRRSAPTPGPTRTSGSSPVPSPSRRGRSFGIPRSSGAARRGSEGRRIRGGKRRRS